VSSISSIGFELRRSVYLEYPERIPSVRRQRSTSRFIDYLRDLGIQVIWRWIDERAGGG
jgi:hypothetical protein